MKKLLISIVMVGFFTACDKPQTTQATQEEFSYVLEQFADLRILKYQLPDFENLELNQKKLIYFLSQAALCGRDIYTDQNGKYNLLVRKALENIYETYQGDRTNTDWVNFETYLKRVWFSNGIYHHYSSDKFQPGFCEEYFDELLAHSSPEALPVYGNLSKDETINLLKKLLFDINFMPKKVSSDAKGDIVAKSAVNFYEGVSKKEVEDFYNKMKDPSDTTPISYGLNSKLIKENGALVEEVYHLGGMYAEAIDKIIYWLRQALEVAETNVQRDGIAKLIEYYRTGDLTKWDEYNVIWVNDTVARVDFVNGFIEVYDDPMAMKATWESLVNYKDMEATRRTKIISENAQWFEDHSPIDERFKKKQVKGVSAKVINAATLGGATYPATPIGINLPNADWIRRDHGSKSVTIQNITHAYDQANLTSGFLEEFSYNQDEIDLVRTYGSLSDNLHTDMHECLGHGSGQLLPGVSSEALENYHSPLEETRADLFALYYMMDPKMVELGLIPTLAAAKAQYLSYIRNGIMTQLRRIEPGKNIEQAHMRNRQLIASWCYEKGKPENVIEKKQRDGKTYFVINDYEKLRQLFGELLKEAQRIKSEGDYAAGKKLVEDYGVNVDQTLHTEVLQRFEKLNMAPYSGFVNPVLELVKDGDEITDVKVNYVDSYAGQMLYYSKEYSYLPLIN